MPKPYLSKSYPAAKSVLKRPSKQPSCIVEVEAFLTRCAKEK